MRVRAPILARVCWKACLLNIIWISARDLIKKQLPLVAVDSAWQGAAWLWVRRVLDVGASGRPPRAHTHSEPHTQTSTHAHTYRHTLRQNLTHRPLYTRTPLHAQTETHTHTHSEPHTQTSTHTHTPTRTCSDRTTHTHTHTHTHTPKLHNCVAY